MDVEEEPPKENKGKEGQGKDEEPVTYLTQQNRDLELLSSSQIASQVNRDRVRRD